MENLNDEINEIWDKLLFLQMIANFSSEIILEDLNKEINSFIAVINSNDKNLIEKEIFYYRDFSHNLFTKMEKIYPPKKNYREIAKDWNDQYKNNKEFLIQGIMIGWLEERIDLLKYYKYDYTPYHFKVGLYIHKGLGDIEENFLLSDAFASLVKAEKRITLFENFVKRERDVLKMKGLNQFDDRAMKHLNILKFDICFYSRTAVLTFFSFFECFVNSVGYDFLLRNKDQLAKSEIQILKGKDPEKRNKYLSLTEKLLMFQKIMRRNDKFDPIRIDGSSEFNDLFNYYKELRNASVHFAPNKRNSIWLKHSDWIKIAREASILVTEASLKFWKLCHNSNKGPDYIGRLEYVRLYNLAVESENEIEKLKSEIEG